MTLDELEAEATKLDLASRIELVRRLTESVPTPPAPTEAPQAPPLEAPKVLTDDERERLWLQEAMARSRGLKERQLQTQPPESPLPEGAPFRPPFRPPRPSGEGRGEGRKRPRPSRKKSPVSRRKPQRKPARARAKPAKARARRVKARTKPRSKPRRSRR